MSEENKKPVIPKEVPKEREVPNLNEYNAQVEKRERAHNKETRIPTFETPPIPPKDSKDKD